MRLSSVIPLILIVAACGATAPKLGGPGTVTHVVVCWLNDPGNEAQRQELIDVSRSFADIPGVLHVAVGTALPSERPIVVSDFDVAIVMIFEDQAALDAYLEHPRHVKAVKETLGPLAGKVQIFDIVDR